MRVVEMGNVPEREIECEGCKTILAYTDADIHDAEHQFMTKSIHALAQFIRFSCKSKPGTVSAQKACPALSAFPDPSAMSYNNKVSF